VRAGPVDRGGGRAGMAGPYPPGLAPAAGYLASGRQPKRHRLPCPRRQEPAAPAPGPAQVSAAVHPADSMAGGTGQLTLSVRVHPAAPAVRAGFLRLPHRLHAPPAATAARQPGVRLDPRATAVGTAGVWHGYLNDPPPEADLAGGRRRKETERIVPLPVAECARYGRARDGLSRRLSHGGTHLLRPAGTRGRTAGWPELSRWRQLCSLFRVRVLPALGHGDEGWGLTSLP